ncbi:helix-turn-helix transcriptional regulator [Serratia liquefaciens]|uniref:helix-turn-helix transcriptional regulator n=1 Tax=Serratia liquefaciens TaxID=614 RepID=UPI00215776F0|nr:LuxR family transcriptional regulator [Serratia liquefaciens]
MSIYIYVSSHEVDQYFSFGIAQMIYEKAIFDHDTDTDLEVNFIHSSNNKTEICHSPRVDIAVYECRDDTSRMFFPCKRDGACIFKKDPLVRSIDSINRAINLLIDGKKEEAKNCTQCSLPQLTNMEHHVLEALSMGLSSTAIAKINSLSSKTISIYKRRLMRKLSIKNNTELNYFILKSKEFIRRKATISIVLQK